MSFDVVTQAEITLDTAYTKYLNDKVTDKHGSGGKRPATHMSDLYGCLLKAWLKRVLPENQWMPTGASNPMLSWEQGLQFEAFVSEGSTQKATAYCFKCRAVSHPGKDTEGNEQVACPVCGDRWLIGTPDFIVDGIIYEAKQTRKSQRAGVRGAPWWVEQLAGYILFWRRSHPEESSNWGRIAANWLMGDWGSRRKGFRSRPPSSVLEGFKVAFPDTKDFWDSWESELLRRKGIVEGDVRPLLSFPGDDVDSPRYEWECPSCPVGKAGACSNWIWNDDDSEIVVSFEDDTPS